MRWMTASSLVLVLVAGNGLAAAPDEGRDPTPATGVERRRAEPKARLLDLQAGFSLPFALPSVLNSSTLGASVGVNYRPFERWGARLALSWYVNVRVPENVTGAPVSTRFLDGVAELQVFAVPVFVSLGATGRLELRLALGSGGGLTRTLTLDPSSEVTSTTLSATWVPVSFTPTLAFYIGSRVCLFVEANAAVMPFLSQADALDFLAARATAGLGLSF